MAESLTKERSKGAVSIVGLGYVGLPLARAFVSSGYTVKGIDLDARKIARLNSGKSYLSDMSDKDIGELNQTGRFTCQATYDAVAHTDTVVICVPTPLTEAGLPDLTHIEHAAKELAGRLRKNQLIVLESSTFPGTTDEHLAPILEQSGLKADVDFFLAYSPERINPGDPTDLRSIPKVVGGIGEASTTVAANLYRNVFDEVVVVSSTRIAEFTKILENTQRFVNVSLCNELAMLCERLDINIWEAIAAADTKPYGFTVYHPGPGIGGHCIPVDPLYLEFKAQQVGFSSGFIRLAQDINHKMPEYIVERIFKLMDSDQPKVLIVGLAYKKNVNDIRESSAVTVMEKLRARGVDVSYHDRYIPEIRVESAAVSSVELTPDRIQAFDCVAILADHDYVDYALIARHAKIVLDTRHAVPEREVHPNVVYL
ncbi:MAG: nucleotide sugar dehydrogenase [Bacilli bacterium]